MIIYMHLNNSFHEGSWCFSSLFSVLTFCLNFSIFDCVLNYLVVVFIQFYFLHSTISVLNVRPHPSLSLDNSILPWSGRGDFIVCCDVPESYAGWHVSSCRLTEARQVSKVHDGPDIAIQPLSFLSFLSRSFISTFVCSILHGLFLCASSCLSSVIHNLLALNDPHYR